MARTTLMYAGLAASVVAGFAACSLDLDESLIDVDAGSSGTGGSAGSGGSSGSGGGGGSGGLPIEGGAGCDANSQCTSDSGCVEGTCKSGACSFALCPSSAACTARACNNDTCSMPATYGFKTAEIMIGKKVGCGGSVERCLAAFGDYVFVGTVDGEIRGYRVDNPTAPTEIQVQRPTFGITQLLASEQRVLLVGPTAAQQLSLAWFDLPVDPLATIVPQSVGVNFDDSFSSAFPAEVGSFFVVKNSEPEAHPAAFLDPPFMNPLRLFASPGIAPGAVIVGSSGRRLVTYRTETVASTQTEFHARFSLETSAGTSSAQNGTEQDVFADAGDVPSAAAAHNFASSFNGALLWTTNRVTVDAVNGNTMDATVFRWPLLDSSETDFNAARSVVLETYPAAAPDTAYAGPSALIDASTAIATTADPTNVSQSVVHVVTRSGDTLTLEPQRFQVPFSVSQLGVAAGRRFGYVLTTTGGDPPDLTLSVFAPGCGAP